MRAEKLDLVNNADTIFGNKKLIVRRDKFQCPVCKKLYKQEKMAQNHIDSRVCIEPQDLFRNTITENEMYKLYQYAMELKQQTTDIATSLVAFRHSREYVPLARLLIFCSANKIYNRQQYVEYLIYSCPRIEQLSFIFSIGKKDSELLKYRKFLQNNPELIENEPFFSRNKETLQTDLAFVLRSLDRADVSVDYLYRNLDIIALLNHPDTTDYLRAQFSAWKVITP